MSSAALIPASVLNDNANRLICSTMRQNIIKVLNGPMFKKKERVAAVIKVGQCHNPAQLQRWYENLHKLRQEREAQEFGTDYTTGLDNAA